MNYRCPRLIAITRIAAVALSVAIMSVPAYGAAQPKPLKGGPRANWTDTWVVADTFLDRQDGTALALRNGREENDSQYNFLPPPKLAPEAAKRAKAHADAEAAAGAAINPEQCKPSGLPGFWMGLYAFEIIQSPDQINVFQEAGGQTRRIHLDGRKHPSLDDAEPLDLGHSIGHWEGDTLVVDTVNFDTDMLIAGPGTNHTEKSHMVERFRPVGEDRIDVDITLFNPDVLAEPYHIVRRLKRKPDTEIMDYGCDNNRNPIDAEGREKVILSPK